jgi:hypothetical protein
MTRIAIAVGAVLGATLLDLRLVEAEFRIHGQAM